MIRRPAGKNLPVGRIANPSYGSLAAASPLPLADQLKRSKKRPRARRRSSGLSLLEVILALAILGVTLTILGELMRVGAFSAVDTRHATEAQLLCESIVAEIVAASQAPETTNRSPIETAPGWLYSVETADLDGGGMLWLRVTLEREALGARQPLRFSLTRWMIDPEIEAEIMAAAEEQTAAAGGADG